MSRHSELQIARIGFSMYLRQITNQNRYLVGEGQFLLSEPLFSQINKFEGWNERNVVPLSSSLVWQYFVNKPENFIVFGLIVKVEQINYVIKNDKIGIVIAISFMIRSLIARLMGLQHAIDTCMRWVNTKRHLLTEERAAMTVMCGLGFLRWFFTAI